MIVKLLLAIVPVVAMFCEPKSGLIFVPAIAADALISAFTIVPSTIFALATVRLLVKLHQQF